MWVECARLANLPSIHELVNAKKFYNRALKHCNKISDRKAYIQLKIEKFKVYLQMHDY